MADVSMPTKRDLGFLSDIVAPTSVLLGLRCKGRRLWSGYWIYTPNEVPEVTSTKNYQVFSLSWRISWRSDEANRQDFEEISGSSGANCLRTAQLNCIADYGRRTSSSLRVVLFAEQALKHTPEHARRRRRFMPLVPSNTVSVSTTTTFRSTSCS